MKYVWLIAIGLLILCGFNTAANFVAIVLVGGMFLLLAASVFMAIMELISLKIWSALKWAVAAGFLVWLLRICL